MVKLKILNNDLEDVDYNFKDFHIYSRKGTLSNFPNMRAVIHWHKDFEFIIPLKGNISYFINGQTYLLKERQALFVNSEQMHYGYSDDGSDCIFLCILIAPSLFSISSLIHKKYITQILEDSNHPFYIFDLSIAWHRNFVDTLIDIYKLCKNKKDGFEMNVMSSVFSICYMLYNNVKNDISQRNICENKNIIILHNMTKFIQDNYSKKITLKDIALSGNVCKSSCCEIFRSVLDKSPFIYLTEYRLEKSTQLLNNPSYSITEVALISGFSNSSYFTETFRKHLGYTPSQYRKRHLVRYSSYDVTCSSEF